ncbi:MAG: hypothetical protein V7756_13370, partial [Halopseudomonas sp.]|uniref:hypothetical protein n=1 Tax=Halopseudomonas sp. TaxID=2901191 RepID=UPI00300277D4
LIKARSTVLQIEAGYTTDNLLLLSKTGGLAMREETIYDRPGSSQHGMSGNRVIANSAAGIKNPIPGIWYRIFFGNPAQRSNEASNRAFPRVCYQI